MARVLGLEEGVCHWLPIYPIPNIPTASHFPEMTNPWVGSKCPERSLLPTLQ